MTFKIGMKVVCVAECEDETPGPWPQVGGVYTIAWMGIPKPGALLTLDLVECPSPETFWTYRGYLSTSFRPAVSPKQQVSFTTGAPRDSRKWDNRRKRVEVVA